jgi:antitoxin (DNA-binding transcriptional repressor) of toxin-antitoxin stability system
MTHLPAKPFPIRIGYHVLEEDHVMQTATVEDVQARLPQILDVLAPGEEVVITRDGKPVARLTGSGEKPRIPHRLGTLKGTVTYMAPDFDAPLEDFKEYME